MKNLSIFEPQIEKHHAYKKKKHVLELALDMIQPAPTFSCNAKS